MNPHVNQQYWMNICDQVAMASTCRVKIRCVLVYRKNIVGTGYVGSISGDIHCNGDCLLVENYGLQGSDDKGKSCIRTSHAEMNAILKCTVRLTNEDAQRQEFVCYCTYEPCLMCFKLLLQIGVRAIYFRKRYIDKNRELLISNLDKSINDYLYTGLL